MTNLCLGQTTFGLQLGLVNRARQGSALCDSIAVEELTAMESLFIGLFYNTHVSSAILLRGELNYSGNSLGALLYNTDDGCTLCPVKKGISTFYGTFELPVSLHYSLRLARWVSVGPLGGLGFHMNVGKRDRPIALGGRYQGVIDVAHGLRNARTTVLATYLYGLRMDVWRLTLIARYQHNLGSSATGNIRVWNNEYPFRTSVSAVHLSISYNMHKLAVGTRERKTD